MFRNYILSAFRHFRKNKNFSLLNTLGLSLGMACSILIFLWIENEMSYDRFHAHFKNLYQVMDHQTYEGKTYTFSALPGPFAAAAKTEIPGFKHTARSDWGDHWLFAVGEKSIYQDGCLVDPEFLDMFSFPMVKGDPKTALKERTSIVITEKMAKNIFGNDDPIGKTVRVNNEETFTVTGVLRDVPSNSTISFDWLAPFTNYEKNAPWHTSWNSNSILTYAELEDGADVNAINKKLDPFIQTKAKDAMARPVLFHIRQWRLYTFDDNGNVTDGRITYVRMFGVIALLIIIIACINFMNLATARSEKRMKEVGVRKTLGANKRMLVLQFLGEAMVMSFFALIIACGIVLLTLPFFNKIVDQEISLHFSSPVEWLMLIGIAAVCGLLAGSYPSFYLSSFSALSAFRDARMGKFSRTAFIRKGLVVTQFVISVGLIVCAVVIYQQIEHVKSRQLGFDRENLLHAPLTTNEQTHFDALKNDLLASGVVANAGMSSSRLLELNSNTNKVTWEGQDKASETLITVEDVSVGFIETSGIGMKTGRTFESPVKDSDNVVINETLQKMIGKDDVLGMTIYHGDRPLHIIGVAKDFVYNDMYQPPAPLFFLCNPSFTSQLFIRLKSGQNVSSAVDKVTQVVHKYEPAYPFEYKFVNDDFDRQFRAEMLVGKLSRLFAILTIIISCLGLFGLAAYTAERRTKEIGIRKTLGASISGIVLLLTKDFLVLVLIAIVIAVPLAWYVMHKWLQDYAYRIEISWWVFAAAGFGAITIAVITVSFQAIRAAVANPVKSLRTE